MNIIEKIGIAFVGALLALMGFWASHIFSSGSTQKSFGDTGASTIFSTMSNAPIQVGPQNSVRVLATSTARLFAELTATSTVYCNLSDVAASATNGAGVSLGLGQSFTISPQNLYIGAIQCSAPASTTLSVTSFQ